MDVLESLALMGAVFNPTPMNSFFLSKKHDTKRKLLKVSYFIFFIVTEKQGNNLVKSQRHSHANKSHALPGKTLKQV